MDGFGVGLLLLVIAGMMNASFTIPMKLLRNWAWENVWLVWSALALIVLPSITAALALPDLAAIYRASDLRTLLLVFAFGAGWVLAQVVFGIVVEAIGIALAFPLVLGTSAAIGALAPMVLLHREEAATAVGRSLLFGVAQMLFGVALCAFAGRMREKAEMSEGHDRSGNSVRGVTLAIVCGAAASLQGVGMVYGEPLSKLAIVHGANRTIAAIAIWLPLLVAGAIPNLAFCAVLLKKQASWSKFKAGKSDHWILAFVMAAFWFGSLLLYGASVSKMGSLGAVFGWPLYMSFIVICASVLGIVTKEWKESGRLPLTIQLSGLANITAAVFVLGKAGRTLG